MKMELQAKVTEKSTIETTTGCHHRDCSIQIQNYSRKAEGKRKWEKPLMLRASFLDPTVSLHFTSSRAFL
ncbi:hypothetical protein LR48_Vigan09g085200 [Vigna angularis]|uniref:Uncharacterized protein n=1 Tax=Phaseolus angularis TaxID=3914 RepID=A0A0L9VB10_PHAAN|nr:hypothetical protein LR48_Vigan09g085200 [Vigna angularis]